MAEPRLLLTVLMLNATACYSSYAVSSLSNNVFFPKYHSSGVSRLLGLRKLNIVYPTLTQGKTKGRLNDI